MACAGQGRRSQPLANSRGLFFSFRQTVGDKLTPFRPAALPKGTFKRRPAGPFRVSSGREVRSTPCRLLTPCGHGVVRIRLTDHCDAMSGVQSIFSPSALTTGVQRAISAARVRRSFSGFGSRVRFHARVDQHLLVGRFGDRGARRLCNLFGDFNRRPSRCEHPNGARHGQTGEAQFSRRRKLRRSDETGGNSSQQAPASCRHDGIQAPGRSRPTRR